MNRDYESADQGRLPRPVNAHSWIWLVVAVVAITTIGNTIS